MKALPFFALLSVLVWGGCASNTPPAPRPFMGILSAKKIDPVAREYSRYQVAVHYENVVPGAYEIKVGFGYTPSEEDMARIAPTEQGVYATAYTTVLNDAAGDLRITIDPAAVRNLRGKLDGKVHAILSKYPHPEEWPVVIHDVFVLDPE